MMKVLRALDDRLFRGRLQRLHSDYIERSQPVRDRATLRRLAEHQDHCFAVYYRPDDANELSALCDRYGSDKGSTRTSGHRYAWRPHTYTDVYSRLYGHCRDSIRTVFECGIGTDDPAITSTMGVQGKPGASLRTWRDYFPNATVFGADIDPKILFEEERIRTFQMDQTDPASIAAYWSKVEEESFDLMIDDGLHTFEAGACLFEGSRAKLAPRGIYVIEDVEVTDMQRYQELFSGTPYKVDYIALHRPGIGLKSNCMVMVRH